MKIEHWLITLSFILVCSTCQSEQPEPLEAKEDSKPSTASTEVPEKTPNDYILNKLSLLIHENVLLVLGGSPSLSFDLNQADLYSYRLEKFLEKEYNILNAAIANEPTEQLIKRLPILFQHEINAIVLELGADEIRKQLNEDSFQQKISILLKEIQQNKRDLPILIIPSSNKSTYLNIIEAHIDTLPNAYIITPADFSPLSAEWHEFIARQIAKQLSK